MTEQELQEYLPCWSSRAHIESLCVRCVPRSCAKPEHEHLPSAKELNRMMVDSFARAVALWDEREAPARGIVQDSADG